MIRFIVSPLNKTVTSLAATIPTNCNGSVFGGKTCKHWSLRREQKYIRTKSYLLINKSFVEGKKALVLKRMLFFQLIIKKKRSLIKFSWRFYHAHPLKSDNFSYKPKFSGLTVPSLVAKSLFNLLCHQRCFHCNWWVLLSRYVSRTSKRLPVGGTLKGVMWVNHSDKTVFPCADYVVRDVLIILWMKM